MTTALLLSEEQSKFDMLTSWYMRLHGNFRFVPTWSPVMACKELAKAEAIRQALAVKKYPSIKNS